ncbi:MAG TPA: 50S ribosomal protein L6 [Candidatus Nanoarchaeia archaeon]|nr:50S ribosomal protein L6 [Candidatus Nanoarchaeia archaeon]
MKLKIDESVEMPSGVTVSYADGLLTVKGPKGECVRVIREPSIKISVEDNKLKLACKSASKREKRIINTCIAHAKNMIKGSQELYQYHLKICSGHFPMNVSISGDQFIIKNFLGEKNPRTMTLKKGAVVKIDEDKILVEGADKELAGQIASDIELLTAKRNRDLRVFQDGIYLTEKAGKKVFEQ